jgi:hypothetical protein
LFFGVILSLKTKFVGEYMKKLVKMSLVAAVAVAGLSSTSSAKPLEESIKNTDLSGYIRYRYTGGEANADATNEYKTVFKVKSKVNDNVSAFLKVAGAAKTSDTADDNGNAGDADPDLTLFKCANFQYTNGKITAIVGKQGLATPFADKADQQGTGIVALAPMGGVTLAAGLYTNSDAKTKAAIPDKTVDLGGNNIGAVGAIGAAGPAKFALWYANISEHGQAATAGATAINLNVSATVGPASIEVNHASVDYTGDSIKGSELNPTQSRIVASVGVAGATVTAGVVMAGEDGADVTLGDGDASANFVMEEFDATDLKDTTAMYLGVSAPVGPVTVGLEHGTTSDTDGSKEGDTDASETKVSLAYKMSKNFKISGWVTQTDGAYDGKDANRIEVKYTF